MPEKTNDDDRLISLPDTIDIKVKSEEFSSHSTRKNSLGMAADDIFGTFLSNSPSNFSPGNLDAPIYKRNRSGSVSGRLRSASDLEDRGVINRYQKGILKDLIISGDPALLDALDKFQNGDSAALEALIEEGTFNQKVTHDLLDDLDFGFLNVGSLGDPSNDDFDDSHSTDHGLMDDFDFDSAFLDIPTNKNLDVGSYIGVSGMSLPNSLPTIGMGITPPNPFGFVDEFLNSDHSEDLEKNQLDDETKLPDDAVGKTDDEEEKSDENNEDNEHPEIDSQDNSSESTQPISIPGSKFMADDPNKKFVGAYSPDSRRKRVEKFLEKRQRRVWTKKVKYDVRKNFADSRLRVKGRFVKKEDEQLLRELLSLT